MLEIKGSKTGQPAYYKPQSGSGGFWQGFLKVLLVVFIISILLIGAVVLYAWYSSQHDGGDKSSTTTIKPTPTPQKHSKPASDAFIGVSTQFLSSPVAPGENATMSIHTNADARCTITVKYGNTTAIDSGLMPKIADDYGLVQWSWTIPASTAAGSNPVDVWCANAKHNAHVLENLVVKPSA